MANRSEIVRGMGLGMDIVDKLAKAIVDAGGREDCLGFLATPAAQQTLAKIGGVVVDALNEKYVKKVVVERRITIQDAIALGGYDEVDPRIEQFFQFFRLPISDDVIRETVAIHPLCFYYQVPMSNAEHTVATLKKRGYRPAGIAELLALGAAREEHSIGLTFALGSVAGPIDTGLIPYIDSDWLPYDEVQYCRPTKRCLRLIEGSDVEIKQYECDRRNNARSYRHFVLAVRE